jgi:hypothetical protein
MYGTDEKALDSLRRLEWAARDLAERIQEYLGEEE